MTDSCLTHLPGKSVHLECVLILTCSILKIFSVEVRGFAWVDLGVFLRSLTLTDVVPGVTNYRL